MGGIIYRTVLIVGMWIVGIACIALMQKIEPNNKTYPIWVLFILVVFTLFSFFAICAGGH